jgi:hypothetical protein
VGIGTPNTTRTLASRLHRKSGAGARSALRALRMNPEFDAALPAPLRCRPMMGIKRLRS